MRIFIQFLERFSEIHEKNLFTQKRENIFLPFLLPSVDSLLLSFCRTFRLLCSAKKSDWNVIRCSKLMFRLKWNMHDRSLKILWMPAVKSAFLLRKSRPTKLGVIISKYNKKRTKLRKKNISFCCWIRIKIKSIHWTFAEGRINHFLAPEGDIVHGQPSSSNFRTNIRTSEHI